MDFHIIVPGQPADLVARLVDGSLVIVPPAAAAPAALATEINPASADIR